VDSAFDTAIAALSCQKNLIFPDDRMASGSREPEPLEGRPIACLKLGVGHTYGWTLLE
jgi:hypothetical protein